MSSHTQYFYFFTFVLLLFRTLQVFFTVSTDLQLIQELRSVYMMIWFTVYKFRNPKKKCALKFTADVGNMIKLNPDDSEGCKEQLKAMGKKSSEVDLELRFCKWITVYVLIFQTTSSVTKFKLAFPELLTTSKVLHQQLSFHSCTKQHNSSSNRS